MKSCLQWGNKFRSQATSGEIVATDLGLKPMIYHIFKQKLTFHYIALSVPSGEQPCQDMYGLAYQLAKGVTKYIEEINKIKLDWCGSRDWMKMGV